MDKVKTLFLRGGTAADNILRMTGKKRCWTTLLFKEWGCTAWIFNEQMRSSKLLLGDDDPGLRVAPAAAVAADSTGLLFKLRTIFLLTRNRGRVSTHPTQNGMGGITQDSG